jgi:flagellar FliL protein
MADEKNKSAKAIDAREADDTGAETPPPGRSRLKRPMLIAALVIALAGGGGGAAYFAGLLDGVFGTAASAEDAAAAAARQVVFFPLPDLVVTLNTNERRTTFLKLRVSLELASAADVEHVERMLPRLVDYCQIYLREMRVEDLRGSAGTMRLREELLRRVAAAVAPAHVNDVLFGEMLIQ